MFAFEIFQIIDKKWGYFKQLSNLVKQTSYVLVLVMLIKNEWFIDTFYDIPRDLMLTAIVIALTWYKLFYWMKLFNTTAFFMNVFTKTFEDSNFQAFFIMTVIMILSFANIIYILNIDRGPTYLYADEDGTIQNNYLFPESLESGYTNAFLYSYKMSLGDFATSGYAGKNQNFIWVSFFFATFLL